MEKYLIYYNDTPTSKKYVEYINRNGETTDNDMGDAIEFDGDELALMICEFLNRRNCHRNNYKVMRIKTIIEEDIEQTNER